MAREVTDRRRAAWRAACRTSTRRTGRDYARARAHRRPGGERVRIGAAAAQFEVVAVSRRASATRAASSARYLTDSTGLSVTRVHPEDDGTACRTTKTAPAARISTCRGGSTTEEARFPARLPHRAGRRTADRPAFGILGGIQRYNGRCGGIRQAVAEGRLPALLRRDGQLRGPRRDDPQRRHATARSIPSVVDTWGIPVLRFHCKFGGPRDPAGEAHAGDVSRDHRRDGRHAAVADADARAAATASSPAGASFTRSGRRGWATIRRRPC